MREVNPAPLGRRRKVELQLTIQGLDMGEKNPNNHLGLSPLEGEGRRINPGGDEGGWCGGG